MFIEPINNSVFTGRLVKSGIVLGAFLFGHLLGQAEYNKVAEQLLLSDIERETLDTENRQMSAELSAMVQQAYTSDEAVAGLQQSLSNLRAQRLAEREELQIFRNLATGGENITGIAVDGVSITAMGGNQGASHYSLGLRLTQPRGRKRVAGEVRVRLLGQNASGEAVAIPLEDIRQAAVSAQQQVSSATSGDYPDFDFRYFQHFHTELLLPHGFTPELLTIVANPVNPYRSSVKKVSLTVPWETSLSASLASLTD